jgi:hypothetical protein
MSLARGQMARSSIFGPMQGIATVSGRAVTPAPNMPSPPRKDWGSTPTGFFATPSVSALPTGGVPAAASSGADTTTPPGGTCCG